MNGNGPRLSIFGLGYVGSVSAACFAHGGRSVIGVDPHRVKVDLINEGKSPVIETGVSGMMAEAVRAERLRATVDPAEAVRNSDISIVCVGTPSRGNGSLDTDHVLAVCREIGEALRSKERHIVVIRSTILPGTMRALIQPALEQASGKKAGRDFGLCNNPEFLRESTAVEDFYNPPKTVIGSLDEGSGRQVAELYAGIDAPLILTQVEVAEMVKYTDNAWHGLKVAFGNEIGNICKALGIDSHRVMDIFCRDVKLNLSPYYLKPGFAFGGSCLPKDLRALTHMARQLDLKLPVLESVMSSNQQQVERALHLIAKKDRRRVGVLGFSFKAGTDDLRESPLVELIERLLGKGHTLRLFDHNVNLARLVGANREYILHRIPHIAALMADSIDEVLEHGDIIVVGNNDRSFHDVAGRLRDDQILVDMVRLPDAAAIASRLNGHYDGINW